MDNGARCDEAGLMLGFLPSRQTIKLPAFRPLTRRMKDPQDLNLL